MARVLVTGGAGFIGSRLCERLVERGHQVVAVDDLSTGRLGNLATLQGSPAFSFERRDVNTEDLSDLFGRAGFDYVCHHAAVVGVRRTLESPLLVLHDIDGIRQLLEQSRRFAVKRLVFASSSEVYGQPVEFPEREDGHVNAQLPYAVTKLMGEKYLQAYWQEHGLSTCALRFFNVYGPRQDTSAYGFVVGIFIGQVLRGEPPTILGDGSQTRDFVYIDDNVEATIRALDAPGLDGEVVNVGTGRPSTVLDLAEEVIRLCGQEGRLEPVFLEERAYEIRHRFPNIGKMRALLGYRPATALREGLARTIAYYRAGL